LKKQQAGTKRRSRGRLAGVVAAALALAAASGSRTAPVAAFGSSAEQLV
jgi:hypothetical protein